MAIDSIKNATVTQLKSPVQVSSNVAKVSESVNTEVGTDNFTAKTQEASTSKVIIKDVETNSADTKQSNEQIRRAVEQLNRKMMNSEAVFGIHDATNRVTIKIIDKETKEVIKELPAEKTLDMIAKVWELAGILVDEKR